MNKLSNERKIQILKMLVEGMSIRSVERITGTHRDTIIRLMVRIGKGCEKLLEDNMKGFHSKYLQADEIWAYVGKKERKLTRKEKKSRVLGDQYVFVALDAETKLIPLYTIGKRSMDSTNYFIGKLKHVLRGNGRIQLTTDSYGAYENAIEQTFGMDIDYAQQTKTYRAEIAGAGRYSPPRISDVLSRIVQGTPDVEHISTSLVERHNLTMRMNMRRLTRLTNAFSKKLDNLKASVALYFAHYNFMRIHQSLRMTPAMEAGIAERIWDWNDILKYEE